MYKLHQIIFNCTLVQMSSERIFVYSQLVYKKMYILLYVNIGYKVKSCKAINLWWKEPKSRNNINPGLEPLSDETTEQ
ncbi:hypothetical protein NQ314_015808 [Rhamnusium bicolor]|uniref:Uncharacterized protein n=1 Tax=Rhamnusium bicolor TaxID=1586634 RepID=A0AAV8WXY3_9CUCU|nr:hypothetical protein NQ314_015808 [Rhamnusium bicolor]